jgi:SAM-dependent methyltransferase
MAGTVRRSRADGLRREVEMSHKVDLFDSTYSHFEAEVHARVRSRTFGEDFGQNSWTTADEYRRWIRMLGLGAASNVLEVASGSGGPALFVAQQTGCRVHGVDINGNGVATANERARRMGIEVRAVFREASADDALPYADGAFDALLCVDSANHFPRRLDVLRDWRRVLRPGGRVLFTDPVVVTGLVSNEELAARSSIGHFVFAPPGLNERFAVAAGFELLQVEDVTTNAAMVSARWRDARAADRAALVQIEGEQRFEGLQRFFDAVHRLTSERRLSRIAYLLAKSATS